MPGVFQYSIDRLGEIMEEVKASGISGVLLFGIPACKDEMGSQAYARDGITQRAVAYIKKIIRIFIVSWMCVFVNIPPTATAVW